MRTDQEVALEIESLRKKLNATIEEAVMENKIEVRIDLREKYNLPVGVVPVVSIKVSKVLP